MKLVPSANHLIASRQMSRPRTSNPDHPSDSSQFDCQIDVFVLY